MSQVLNFYNLPISTQTVMAYFNCTFNIINIDDILLKHETLEVKHGNVSNVQGKSKKPISKGHFGNQASLKLYIIDKYITIKIFRTGKVHMTGCTSNKHCHEAVYILFNIIKKYHTIEKPTFEINANEKSIEIILEVVMLNVDFKLGFNIDQIALDKLINETLHKKINIQQICKDLSNCINQDSLKLFNYLKPHDQCSVLKQLFIKFFNEKHDTGTEYIEMLIKLIKHNVHVETIIDKTDYYGYTFLMIAVKNGCSKLVLRKLISNDADIYVVDRYGKTVLDYARERSQKLADYIITVSDNKKIKRKKARKIHVYNEFYTIFEPTLHTSVNIKMEYPDPKEKLFDKITINDDSYTLTQVNECLYSKPKPIRKHTFLVFSSSKVIQSGRFYNTEMKPVFDKFIKFINDNKEKIEVKIQSEKFDMSQLEGL